MQWAYHDKTDVWWNVWSVNLIPSCQESKGGVLLKIRNATSGDMNARSFRNPKLKLYNAKKWMYETAHRSIGFAAMQLNNDHRCTHDIVKYIFLYENWCILLQIQYFGAQFHRSTSLHCIIWLWGYESFMRSCLHWSCVLFVLWIIICSIGDKNPICHQTIFSHLWQTVMRLCAKFPCYWLVFTRSWQTAKYLYMHVRCTECSDTL